MPKQRKNCFLSVIFIIGVSELLISACGAAPPPPAEEPLYTPSYSYSVAQSGQKIDVTIGLIAPQFAGVAATAEKDELTQNYVSGLRSGFNELLTAKGFNLTGPFESMEVMTFPEKKGADFILFPELDVRYNQKIDITGQKQGGNPLSGYTTVSTCDITLSIGGSISVIVEEPLSGEKMWVKRVELTGTPQKYSAEGNACQGKEESLPRDVVNGRAKLFEGMFTQVMSGLDKYVNAEEFVILKTQAMELREKKAY